MNNKKIRTIILVDEDSNIRLFPVREQDNVETSFIYYPEDYDRDFITQILKITPQRIAGMELKLDYGIPTPDCIYQEGTLGAFLDGIYSK